MTRTQFLADGADFGHMAGVGWGMALVWGIIGVTVVVIVILTLQRGQTHRMADEQSAIDLLSDRFARGDIDEEEFRDRRAVLEE